MTDDRLAWLTARLVELGELARRARQAYTVQERYAEHPGELLWPPPAARRYEDGEMTVGVELIGLFGPEAVSALVEAHRRILAEHQPAAILGYAGQPANSTNRLVACRICGRDPRLKHRYPCETVMALLAAHRYAPGFREEWLA